MKQLLLLLGCFVGLSAFADTPFNTFTTGLTGATTPTGTEVIPCVQGGTSVKCTTAQMIQVPSAAFTTLCNPTNASSTLQQCAPLQSQTVANYEIAAGHAVTAGNDGITVTFTTPLQIGATSGTLTAGFTGTSGTYYVAFGTVVQTDLRLVVLTNGGTAITWTGGLSTATGTGARVLGGLGAIDGITPLDGESVAVYNGSNATIQQGIWTVHSGPWTIATNWSMGVALSAGCNISIFVQAGTTLKGHTLSATVTGTIVTGTNLLSISDTTLGLATTTAAGLIASTTQVQSGTFFPAVIFSASFSPSTVGHVATFADTKGTIQEGGGFPALGLSTPSGTATFAVGTGITSVVCASGYSCNNTRGTLTIVGGTATTGTIATVSFSAALSAAPSCVSTMNGGVTFFGIGNSSPTTTAFNITAAVSVIGATFNVNYGCLP